MANYTRSNGANARAAGWDEFAEERVSDRTGSWLPLDVLDETTYEAGPQLHAVPTAPAMPRRTMFPARQPQPAPIQPTRPHPAQAPVKGRTAEVAARPAAAPAGLQARAVAILAGAAIAVLAAYVAVSAAVEWTQVKLDDIQYGRPRTTQIDAYVGHGEADGVPSHFIAMNLNRRITVLEMPGGDSTKATTIVGPYLFGAGEDLTPVQVSAQDVNLDGKPDLVVSVRNEQLTYLNDGTAFKLITPEEHAALQKTLANSAPRATTPAEAGK